MPASGVQFTFSGVSVTYGSTPTVVALTQQMSIEVIYDDVIDEWQPSGAEFATVVVVTTRRRGVRLSGGEINKLITIPSGTPCIVAGIIHDAFNGTGTGAIQISLANAIKQGGGFGSSARKFAQGGVEFTAYSSDGTADPMTLTVVS